MTDKNNDDGRSKRQRTLRQTSAQFRLELKKALDAHYPDWSSEKSRYDLGVSPRTLIRWVGEQQNIHKRGFEDFLRKATRFSPEIRKNLEALYYEKPVTNLSQVIYTMIDSLAATYLQHGNAQEALKVFERMEAAINAKGSPPQSVRIYLRVIEIELNRRMGDSAKATQLADEVRYALGSLDFDLSVLALHHHVEGLRLCWTEGDYLTAGVHFEAATKYYEQDGAPLEQHGVICDRGMNRWCQGELRSAMDDVQRVHGYARDTNNQALRLITQGNLALIYLSQGDLNTALGCVNQQIDLARHYPLEYARARGNRGFIRYYQGEYAEALADVEADLAHYAQTGQTNGYGLAYAWAIQSLCLRAIGDQQGAYEVAQRALAIADRGYESIRVVALRACATCTPDQDEAQTLLTQALSLAEGKQRMHEAGIRLALMRLTDDSAFCTQQHARIVALLTEAGAQDWLSRLKADSLAELPLV